MTDDLIARLRNRGTCSEAHNSCRNDFACEAAANALEADAARIAELEAALKPFADLAEKYDDDVDDQPLWDRDFMPVVGDLRAARAALENKND